MSDDVVGAIESLQGSVEKDLTTIEQLLYDILTTLKRIERNTN